MSPTKKEFIIVSIVANEYNISVDDLTSPNPRPRRPNMFIEPKMMAMYLIRKNTFFSISRVGPMFGYGRTFATSTLNDYIHDKMLHDETFKSRTAKIMAILPEIFNIHK
jgi:chromosomal replication initiation ATPase DnaA